MDEYRNFHIDELHHMDALGLSLERKDGMFIPPQVLISWISVSIEGKTFIKYKCDMYQQIIDSKLGKLLFL